MRHIKSKRSALLLLSLSFVVAPRCYAQGSATSKGERPVFYSAQALASDCQIYISVYFNPDGSRLRDDGQTTVTMEKLATAIRCRMYILGYLDEGLAWMDHNPPRYSPRPTALSDEKPLIDTFIKYVKDHPEQENYAASTLLAICARIVAGADK
jgi:hypothetical protein